MSRIFSRTGSGKTDGCGITTTMAAYTHLLLTTNAVPNYVKLLLTEAITKSQKAMNSYPSVRPDSRTSALGRTSPEALTRDAK